MSLFDPHPQTRFSPKLAVGISMIVAGGAWLLFRALLLPWQALAWWPVLLVFLGLASLWKHGFTRSFGGHVLVVLGLLGLASEFGREYWVEQWWPALLVWLGIVIVLRALHPRPTPCCAGNPANANPPAASPEQGETHE